MATPYRQPIKKGQSGRDVYAVKRAYKRMRVYGWRNLKMTRKAGSVFETATKHIQSNHGLPADGIYGPKTHAIVAKHFKPYEVWLYKHAAIRPPTDLHWAVLGPGADRSGVHTKKRIVDFVAKTAKIYGHPLVIRTGTNHRQYVYGSNRQSRHWTGDAADVGMYGSQLTKLGQAALQAAGMPRWRALLCRGGVYNINGWNILFNTTVGGNHWNHCHMGN